MVKWVNFIAASIYCFSEINTKILGSTYEIVFHSHFGIEILNTYDVDKQLPPPPHVLLLLEIRGKVLSYKGEYLCLMLNCDNKSYENSCLETNSLPWISQMSKWMNMYQLNARSKKSANGLGYVNQIFFSLSGMNLQSVVKQFKQSIIKQFKITVQ